MNPTTHSTFLQNLSRSAAMAALCLLGSAAQAAAVAGTAMYRERMALPPDAVFEAVLQDVARADAPAVTLGRAVLKPAGQTPFRFVIQYDDKDVRELSAGGRYAVRAWVHHRGRMLFTTDTAVPALGNVALPLQVNLVAVSADAPPADRAPTSPLRNTYWKLMQLNGAAVQVTPNQREPHLVLASRGARVSGSGGCNAVMGRFAVRGRALAFTSLASTEMACMGGMEQETQFLRTLSTVAAYRIRSEQLDLLDAGGVVVATLKAVALY